MTANHDDHNQTVTLIAEENATADRDDEAQTVPLAAKETITTDHGQTGLPGTDSSFVSESESSTVDCSQLADLSQPLDEIDAKLDRESQPPSPRSADAPGNDLTPPETPNADKLLPTATTYNSDHGSADSGISASSPSSSDCDQYKTQSEANKVCRDSPSSPDCDRLKQANDDSKVESESPSVDDNKETTSSETYFYQCPRCAYRSTQRHNLSRHFKSNHVTYHCRICSQPVFGHRAIVEHVQQVHKSNDIRYRTGDISREDCDQLAPLIEALQAHNRILVDTSLPVASRQYRKNMQKNKSYEFSADGVTGSPSPGPFTLHPDSPTLVACNNLLSSPDLASTPKLNGGHFFDQIRTVDNVVEFVDDGMRRRRPLILPPVDENGDSGAPFSPVCHIVPVKRRILPLDAWDQCQRESVAWADVEDAVYEKYNQLFHRTWTKFSRTSLFDRALARALGHR